MLATLQHQWPTYCAIILSSAQIKRGVAIKIAKHAAQVNQVIQWALAQEPPKGDRPGADSLPPV